MAEPKEQTTALATTTRKGVVATFAERFDVDPTKVMSLVAATVFKGGKDEPPLSNEEVAAALIVCNAHDLNPFLKEIYAFRSKGKLLIVVSVDGWSKIVNSRKQLNGIEFEEHFDEETGKVQAVTCKIHRKDCALPVVVTEYTHECKRDTIPWNTMPIRMTRNRAFVQCSRIAFSISGIVDEDEAKTIEGNPEFAGKAIIDGATSKTDAVKKLVGARARGAAKPAAQAEAAQQEEPAQEAAAVEHELDQAEERHEPEQTEQRSTGTGTQSAKPADSYF
jgi:phage recombination protein Bet